LTAIVYLLTAGGIGGFNYETKFLICIFLVDLLLLTCTGLNALLIYNPFLKWLLLLLGNCNLGACLG